MDERESKELLETQATTRDLIEDFLYRDLLYKNYLNICGEESKMHKSIRNLQDEKVELQKSMKNMIEEIRKNHKITPAQALRFKQKVAEDKLRFQSNESIKGTHPLLPISVGKFLSKVSTFDMGQTEDTTQELRDGKISTTNVLSQNDVKYNDHQLKMEIANQLEDLSNKIKKKDTEINTQYLKQKFAKTHKKKLRYRLKTLYMTLLKNPKLVS
jgi:hypothetical protein